MQDVWRGGEHEYASNVAAEALGAESPARLRIGTKLERQSEKARKHKEAAERADIKLQIIQYPELNSEGIPQQVVRCNRPVATLSCHGGGLEK